MSGEGPVQRLRAAARALRKAARAEYIEPDGVLGTWVEAQDQALMAQADVAEHQERLITHVLGPLERAAEAQMTRLSLVLNSAERTDKLLARKAEVVAGDMIKTVTPQMVAGVKEALVIREHRYNDLMQLYRGICVVTCTLSLLLGGYLWRLGQDREDVALAARLRPAIQHCEDTSRWYADGKKACLLEDLLPPVPPPAPPTPTILQLPAPAPQPSPQPAPAPTPSSDWQITHPGQPVRFH